MKYLIQTAYSILVAVVWSAFVVGTVVQLYQVF